MAQWHYYDANGDKIGPIRGRDLSQLVRQGIITRTTLVENSEGRIVTAGEIRGLPFSEEGPTAPKNLFCTNCGNSVSEQAPACMLCGAKPVGHRKFCRECATPLNPEQVVCVKCGSAIKTVISSDAVKQVVSQATQFASHASQVSAQMMGQMMEKAGMWERLQSVRQWLFDLHFRDMRLEAVCVWLVRILYVVGLVIIGVIFTGLFIAILYSAVFGMVETGGRPILALLLLPIVCLLFFLALCFFRHFCEQLILFSYGFINLQYLIRSTRIYVDNLNAELETGGVTPVAKASPNTDIFPKPQP